MAVTLGNQTENQSSAASSLTLSNHTIGNNTGRILFVHVAHRDVATAVSSIVRNGQSFTKLVSDDANTTNVIGEVWYLLNPSVGTYDIAITMGASTNIAAQAWDVYGANVDDGVVYHINYPFESGGDTAASREFPSTDDCLAFSCIAKRYGATDNVTSDAGQTNVGEINTGSVQSVVDRKAGANYTQTAGFTWTNGRYAVLINLEVVSADLGLKIIVANADTQLASILATTNYGSATQIYFGESNAAANIVRLLLKWNLSSLAGKTVTSAIMHLRENGDLSSNRRTFEAYRMLQAWVEGEATWVVYSTGNSWPGSAGAGAAGTDREADTISTLSIGSTPSGYFDWTLSTAKVQDWIDGTLANNGLLIKSPDEENDAVGIYSKESSIEYYRPWLILEYSTGIQNIAEVNGISAGNIAEINGVVAGSIAQLQGL